MGSKMPNCLRTAMKRMMTTPMANSSMPWIPMTSGQGEPTQGPACTKRPGPRRDKTKGNLGWPRVKLGQASQQQVFSTEVIRNRGMFPGPGDSMRARPASWTKAALMSTLMLKWKICGSRHIWKTSLSRPMRENGGCVTSHLLQCIKRDV